MPFRGQSTPSPRDRDELDLPRVDLPRGLDRQEIACHRAIQHPDNDVGKILAVYLTNAGESGLRLRVRRKRNRVANEPLSIDELNIFAAANHQIDRRQAVGNFIAAEVLQAQRAIFLLKLHDGCVCGAFADHGFRNIGAAFQVLEFICERGLPRCESDRSQRARPCPHGSASPLRARSGRP
jgi:hypothetical protein